MLLEKKKISDNGYYCVGYDSYSEQYIMETDDSFGNKRYFILSEVLYESFDSNQAELDEFWMECNKLTNANPNFYFSTFTRENDYSQNELLWINRFRELLVGKKRNDIYNTIGLPDKSSEDGKRETFKMNSVRTLIITYIEDICKEVNMLVE